MPDPYGLKKPLKGSNKGYGKKITKPKTYNINYGSTIININVKPYAGLTIMVNDVSGVVYINDGSYYIYFS